jgi:hypothetical protein
MTSTPGITQSSEEMDMIVRKVHHYTFSEDDIRRALAHFVNCRLGTGVTEDKIVIHGIGQNKIYAELSTETQEER